MASIEGQYIVAANVLTVVVGGYMGSNWERRSMGLRMPKFPLEQRGVVRGTLFTMFAIVFAIAAVAGETTR